MSACMEGGSTTCPPLLTGTNYSYWKTKMNMFIKSMDEDVWHIVLTGWKRPVSTDEKGIQTEKHEKDWSKTEQIAANMNSKALNAIFNGIDINQFKIISACECAKEAWEKLQTAYEGTTSVRLSKLQMLATRFEDLRMDESETACDFNSKLCDVSNEAHGLGETYPEVKLVRKVLRSMPDRFTYNVIAIEEASDVDTLRLEDLIANLQTFENKMNISIMDKERMIDLQTVVVTTPSLPLVPMTPHLRYTTRNLENHSNLNTIFSSTGDEDSEDDEECSIEKIQQQLNDILKQCHEVGDENRCLKEKVKELEEENEAVKVNLKAIIDELELENEVLEVKQDFALKDIDNIKELLRHLRNNDCNKTKPIKKNPAPMKNAEPCLNLKCDNSPVATTLEASVSKLNRTMILPSSRLDEILNAHPSNPDKLGLGYTGSKFDGVPNYLKNLHNVYGGQVTLGDGNKAFVKGEVNLDVGGLPNLDNVLYVEGLKSNLLSVSQLCDLYDSVLFTKRKCEVFDQNNRL
ncbi:PREDICTED: uncharacterized protein LOC105973919 [Erythranthe guttata]|uniref:uncharacterized protein LOC105973919 n=1 Tax=Erythranthe guttata TaxID=4155 RepID=UPI00064D87AB|nr:PREDICTED: uncharacterized protein LOC105973919 [Erythranthe guttata]|eukprot:XP_012854414.1 PREDICTED: uncharacterized protein LOC105973919 [Erythranthe guttata]